MVFACFIISWISKEEKGKIFAGLSELVLFFPLRGIWYFLHVPAHCELIYDVIIS